MRRLDHAAVAGHAMGVVNNVAARAGVGDQIDVFADLDTIAGDDPLASFRQIRDRYLAATDRQGALQVHVTSRLGDMTLDRFLGAMCADTLVHTWDVARGACVDDTLDPEAVRAVYAGYMIGFPETPRVAGRYATAIDDAGLAVRAGRADRLHGAATRVA